MPGRDEAPRQVVLVAYEGAQLLDVAGPLQVFATANELAAEDAQGGAPAYALAIVSRRGGLVASSAGLAFATLTLRAVDRRTEPPDTLIVAGGPGVHRAVEDEVLVAWVAAQAARARRTASVCTGAFLVARAGVLAGRRAVTHWKSCALLQQRHPEIRVESDPIHVQDGPVWSSAGVTAGIDLALALVEADLGRRVALRVARHLVVFLKRPGGQSQFSAPLAAQALAAEGDERGFGALHAWIAEHLSEDLRVERLAREARMSPRSFARLYAERLGTTPAKAVETMRIEAARRALEETGSSIKAIAGACGFGDEERMRRTFLRRLRLNPADYRRRFSAGGETGSPSAQARSALDAPGSAERPAALPSRFNTTSPTPAARLHR
jgi:transcriptional regulator GlxA family with amidase domain